MNREEPGMWIVYTMKKWVEQDGVEELTKVFAHFISSCPQSRVLL